ncbi:MAG TPA: zinc-binding dehydrogenase, partial [Ktedonobacterales bacterium]|nr:zinc-binding dehydrogenase [Ktedonobacterales bacterium]
FGSGYVALALALGAAPSRITTILDRDAANEHGTQFIFGSTLTSAETLTMLAVLVAAGELEIPIARVYPLVQVCDAYRELANRHTHGKIVLRP